VQGTKLMESTVNVMSIHKSKGLEFPFVFYPGLSARLRTGDKTNVTLSKTYGILFDAFDEGLKPTITEKLHREATTLDDLSEKMRVWYVALTRARESMTLFIPKKESDLYLDRSSDHVPLTFRKRMKSYKALMQLADNHLIAKKTHVTLDQDFITFKESEAQDVFAQSGGALTYQTYEGKARAFEHVTYSMDQTMWMEASTLKAIDLGNAMHEAFERIDFHRDIPAQIDRLSQDDTMTSHLKTFFAHPMTKRLLGLEVFKEIPFSIQSDAGIQKGIIDLVFVGEDTFTVVDYKLKTTDKEGYKTQVKGYVEYLTERLNRPGQGYLYSIMEGTYVQVV